MFFLKLDNMIYRLVSELTILGINTVVYGPSWRPGEVMDCTHFKFTQSIFGKSSQGGGHTIFKRGVIKRTSYPALTNVKINGLSYVSAIFFSRRPVVTYTCVNFTSIANINTKLDTIKYVLYKLGIRMVLEMRLPIIEIKGCPCPYPCMLQKCCIY